MASLAQDKRIDQIERKQEKTDDRLGDLDKVIVEVRTDLRWIRWITLAIVIESAVIIIQLATN